MRRVAIHLARRCSTIALLGLSATSALAQTAPAAGQDQAAETSSGVPETAQSSDTVADDGANIVVTGTLLRGIAPVGTNVVSMSTGDIAETGALNTNQILAKIPQVSSAFNQVPTLPTNDPGVSVIFPNIRNIPAPSSATTLVLLDGHRLGGSGGFPNVDPDIIPATVIERVDVMPDGGSSIYGSDAVGGVINFISRRRFDGLEAQARYGFGEDYHTLDGSVLVGKDWDTGSGYLAYSYTETSELQGKDRSYFSHFATDTGQCAPGTVAINRAGVVTTYALPGRTPGTISTCNNVADFTIFPRLERHSVFGSITQDLSTGIEANVTAFYSRRESTSHIDFNEPGAQAQTGTITAANPYYVPIAPDTGTQEVRFSFAGLFDNERLNRLEQYGVTPSINAELGGGWQLRALGTIGRSKTEFFEPQLDSGAIAAALAGTTTATALNPYDLAATSPAVLRSIFVNQISTSVQKFQDARVILDGSPISLPGGDVKLAVGAEYTHEHLLSFYSGSFNARAAAGRNTKSVFGEVAVPIFGPDNRTGGFYNLMLSASGRYDDYSTTGGTFNPKFGLTWQPIEQVTLRGNWGKSFNAPPLGDTSVAADTRAVLIPGNPFFDPTDNSANLQARPSVILAGGNPNLAPQKAKTWSFGGDFRPVDGLTLSATYYNIKMTNQITIVPIFTPVQAYRAVYAPWVIKNPTLAQAKAIIGDLPLVGFPTVEAWYNSVPDPANPGQFLAPAVILDARRQNLGVYKQDGIDFSVSYKTDTSFGSLNASVAGTYTLHRKLAATKVDPFTELLDSPGLSRYSFLTSVGGQFGNLGATVNWSHSAGYDISPTLGTQDHVGAFNTVDLYFTYDVRGSGLAENLQFTAYVGNLFDEKPPFYNSTPGYANGSTVGRIIQLGIRKRF